MVQQRQILVALSRESVTRNPIDDRLVDDLKIANINQSKHIYVS